MTSCNNCGAEDFVWADSVRTGILGRGLALRSGGELTLGTRICRACGHADLFLKDLKIVRDPSSWREKEFVTVPPGAPAHLVRPPWLETETPSVRAATPPPPPPVPDASPPPPAPPSAPPAPTPSATAAPETGAGPLASESETNSSPAPKRTPRRRANSKAKGDAPPLIHD